MLDEVEARPRHQIFDRARDEDLVGPGEAGDPRADVNRDPGDASRDDLDLAGVEAGPHLQTKGAYGVADRACTMDRSARAVEGGEEPVSRSCSPISERQRASPISAARLVDSTMSVNMTVASTRVGSGVWRAPVKNSSVSATIASTSPTQGR